MDFQGVDNVDKNYTYVLKPLRYIKCNRNNLTFVALINSLYGCTPDLLFVWLHYWLT